MVALVVALGAVVALLAVLVAGLLRSHADILKALHDLGVGVGDPVDGLGAGAPAGHGAGSGPVPLRMGPPLPPERDSSSAPALAGVTPRGDALAVAPASSDGLTLLAFLTTGCSSCAGFWETFRRSGTTGLPYGTRLVVVTKGPDREIAAEVAALAPPDLPVVMSGEAWDDYEVPGSPFFVLVDGRSGRRVGEGVANGFAQVADLVRRAETELGESRAGGRVPGGAIGIDGPAREAANDRELRAAGILPGDPSLYPRKLEDLYGPGGSAGGAPVVGPVGRAG